MLMNQEWKTKWVQALRSGKYKQGTGKLRGENNTYCCLGVLCDLVDPERWSENIYRKGFLHSETSYYSLPEGVRKTVGLSWSDPQVFAQGLSQGFPISDFNDGAKGIRRMTFLELADIIETQF